MPNLSEFMNSSSAKLATIKRRARASYLPKRVKVNKTKKSKKIERIKEQELK